MSEVEMNEHHVEEESQYVDGECRYCGHSEDDCIGYKCWIKKE